MAATETMSDTHESTYRGLLGSFRYSFQQSDSRLYRSYAIVCAGLGLLITMIIGLGLVVWIVQTADQSAVVTLVRSFLVLVGLLIVIPLFAPVLSVARRHRLRRSNGARYDTALAVGGYLYIVSLYVGLVISVPAEFQSTPTSPVAPIIITLYDLPQAIGMIPPIIAALGIYYLHRRYR